MENVKFFVKLESSAGRSLHSFLELQTQLFKTMVQISRARGRFANVGRMESIGRSIGAAFINIV